jgi:multidrug efflux system outer membrane protein
MHWNLLILATICLSGCILGPSYERPRTEIPETFRFQDTGASEERAPADTRWWAGFEDPVLLDLVSEALEHNQDILVAAANVEGAAAVLTQTRSSLYPQIGYSGSGQRQRASEENATPLSPSVKNPQNALQVLSTVSWELDLWGKIRRLSEAARAEVEAAQAIQRGAVLSVVSAVATQYIQLLGLDMQRAIARQTLAVYAESVRLFELQLQYGRVSRMTVEQARTQYETAAGIIPQLEAEIARTEHALSILLGRNPGPIPRSRTLDDLSIPPVPAGIPSDVLAGRPDIQEAEQKLIAANARIGAARALYFPSISLTAGLGLASEDLSRLFTGSARVWNYKGSITGPIFSAGDIEAQVAQAEAERKASLLTYQSVIRQAFADVEDALVSRTKILELVQAQQRLVTAGREYERLARLQYEGGYAPYLTVLNAQQQLFPAELDYVSYRTSALVTLTTLYKALGGGW